MPRRRANSMVLSIVDQPATRAEQAFATIVVTAMVLTSIVLSVL